MNGKAPDSWDDLASVTLIKSAAGNWNLWATIETGGSIQWPGVLPDPAEAIIALGGVLAKNSSNPPPEIPLGDKLGISPEEVAQKPSPAKRPARRRQVKRQSAAPRKR